MAQILDGKSVARRIQEELKIQIAALPRPPRVAFVRVGEDPASKIYVGLKAQRAEEIGMLSETLLFPKDAKESTVIGAVRALGSDPKIDGILVQLPLPAGLSTKRILAEINPEKDVDGIHPQNMGRLATGDPRFVPCTPAGILELLKAYQIPIAGKHAVIVGRSQIVGLPLSLCLLQANATVTICHSATPRLRGFTQQADILVACAGKPGLLSKSDVKAGAVVIDVGIHRLDTGTVGDVEPGAKDLASHITPVPGGVGPMTVAMLMVNVVKAARLRATPIP